MPATSACGILPLPLNYSKPLHWKKAQGKAYKEGEKQSP